MVRKVSIQTKNGFGWSFGDGGSQVVELTTEHGYAWKATKAGPTPPQEAPANTVAPAITGTAEVGETLTVTNGTWNGTPAPTYARQWYADDEPIEGADGLTYVLTEDEEGAVITVVVTATNAAGSAQATSNATAAVAPESSG